jgi:ribosome maturation factor RimP
VGKERVETSVRRLGEPLATALGYELVEIEYRKEGPDWVLRCTIDQEAGITTDDCRRFSEALSNELDTTDPVPGAYLLEISSPGLERPLIKESDYTRFAGRQVELKLHQAWNGQKVYQGELIGLSGKEPERVIQIKNKEQLTEVPCAALAKARLVADILASEGSQRKR